MTRERIAFVLLVLCLLVSANAWASGANMPWEAPLAKIVDAITGPIAKAIGLIAMIGFGFAIIMSEGGNIAKQALRVIVGLAIAFNAASWGLTFFGFSGGLRL